MNPQAILSQLKDIKTPPAISMWPATSSWYLLGAALLVLMTILVFFLIRTYYKKRRQKKALSLLNDAVNLYQSNPQTALQNISELLRRVALQRFERVQVASLKNEAWLNFLDDKMNSKKHAQAFSKGIGRIIISAPYQKEAHVDIIELKVIVENWIKGVL